MSVALLQIKWSVHERDAHGMINPNVERSGDRVIELRGETTDDCVNCVGNVLNHLQQMMKDMGVEIHVGESSCVQPPKVRGMR